ncbi:acetyltransferase [Microvirgula aerodenitrificans]|uniref:acetyltransferase n=1 Tax=Microvirgula aerodenitrificans TaxID=57480 RepID=UPI0028E373E1|nr:acetyltransferase [Microvirgula aerodenitrificans]
MLDNKPDMGNVKRVAFGLYGASGFGREIMPLLQEHIKIIEKSNAGAVCTPYFIDDSPIATKVNGVSVLSSDAFFRLDCDVRFFNIAIANSKVREMLAIRCLERGAKPFSIQSAQAIVYESNEIGEGGIFCANTMVTSNAKIGKFFHSNIYSYVAHDCVIGDYVTFAPNVHCNGNVHIHNHAYIGAGAILKQGTPEKPLIIGEGAIVGMGAVVTKDVPSYMTVVGNPAREHRKP